ncbi:hypothetical protein [Desulfitobacterium metallireducens]|uniref:Uncharacterized protein n=1 Tax=Desulfitobacterium metallireducens DSM 15288 TaxID=871968 RepID=W0EGA1_9FIRM|nr:hypothetical protein [Desulfitobacterium metallireducens]AHF08548.1 hypothetical protein DESME_08680 [Desulfitobacterium metallireducens DSM 15288]
MSTEQSFLHLFFNTEDEDLWEKLRNLPAEKCSEFTKMALREFFQAHPDLMQTKLSATAVADEVLKEGTVGVDEENGVSVNENSGDDFEDFPEPVEFSLESLFELNPVEVIPDPVQNLLSIIGKEEDEEVLRLFRRTDEHKEE